MGISVVEAVPRPSMLLALSELPRALVELGSLPFARPLLSDTPRGDGHPVLVLPGFLAGDRSTGILRRYLEGIGYDSYAWELGRNLGPKAIGSAGEHLVARLTEVHETTGRKVSLIGWSLGGVMARQLSRRLPHSVRQVISLGSPLAGDPTSSNVWRIYEAATGQKVREPSVIEQMRESELPPPVPSTAIYTKSDGVVPWQNCREPEAPHTDNIEVYGSHCGLGVNAGVLYAIADRLAQPEGEWKPFSRNGLRSLVYPSAGHVN